MIGSDAILEPGNNNHPRASGNFARAIGMYVRELEVVPLIDMIDKLSTMPAKRLEKQVPALRKKGRIAKGMDADIVVFDFATIADQATVERPDLPSKGIEYVLVEGQVVLENGVVNKKVRPGRGIRSEFVRVSESAGTLHWDGAEYPLVAFRDARYFDLHRTAEARLRPCMGRRDAYLHGVRRLVRRGRSGGRFQAGRHARRRAC